MLIRKIHHVAYRCKRLNEVKRDMLDEWSRTKRAPKHAAWMHDGSLAQG